MKLYMLIIICLILQACSSFDASKVENLNGGKVGQIGHGGLGFAKWFPFQALPANSPNSIKQALQLGADGVEVDVQMTRDGHFVLYHDNKLDSKTSDTACIAFKTLSELQSVRYKIGIPFDWFQDEELMTLEELISLARKQEEFPMLHLDLRPYSVCNSAEELEHFETKYVSNLHQFLKNLNPKEKGKVLLISGVQSALLKAKALDSTWQYSYDLTGDFHEGLAWSIENDISFITSKPKLLSKEKVKEAHSKGVQIITFGAKSRSGNLKQLEFNPDYIQTDNLKVLQDLIEGS